MTKIMTTHVGSLPRTQDVVDFIFAREHETPYSQAKFDACMTAACAETVRRQVEVGIDIVSDGETSKISYATYVKDRYTGFSGDSPRTVMDAAHGPKKSNRSVDGSSAGGHSRGRATRLLDSCPTRRVLGPPRQAAPLAPCFGAVVGPCV